MKTKYPNLFGILVVLMLVVSFVMPVSLASPSTAQADPGICKWDTLREPGSLTGTEVIATNSDILDLAVGSDFNTIVAVVDEGFPTFVWGAGAPNNLFKWSNTKGLFWTQSRYNNLTLTPGWSIPVGNNTGRTATPCRQLYNVAMAPDDPNFYAVTSDNASFILGQVGPMTGPREVWVTTNGGGSWMMTNLAQQLTDNETIRCIDVSVDYGGRRDIAVGTANGFGAGRVFVITSVGFAGWRDQLISAASVPAPIPTLNLGAVDFYAVKFSPSYASDASLAIVFADNVTFSLGACDNATPAANVISAGATFYNVCLRDTALDSTNGFALPMPGIEVKDSVWPVAASPGFVTLNKADLELPSDFSGQAASLRRAYVSLDAWGAANKATCSRDGIFRIDDTSVYTLMDTSNIADKSIYSIAYFGTYASGKLLAGERMGYPCTATVPTWFTDSPTTCPIPCWYPALKPTTGAANQAACVSTKSGVGAAILAWAPQGNLAYVATGSLAVVALPAWYLPIVAAPLQLDESALGISRNNGETWNQISLIDTRINYFTDVAPTPDCKTVYLASSDNAAMCGGFDSVWRSSLNPDVTSPLAPQPVGTYWERVFTHVTAPNCLLPQTDWAILRLVPYCADPTGEIIAWGVYDPAPSLNPNQGIAAWSPDFGDYWAMVTPRNAIQDFTFESRTVMYFLTPNGLVQKMPYTGTAWSSTYPSVDSILAFGAHTIAAYPEGKVIVGSNAVMNGAVCASSYCGNFNTDSPAFAIQILSGRTIGEAGNVHVAFDPNFKDNNIYYIGVESIPGSVYRNNPAAQLRWPDTNMMAPANGAIMTPPPIHSGGQFGIALAFTGQALYSAHNTALICGVDRTIDDGTGNFGPLSGMPKPGIAWDHLGVNLPLTVCFQAQPSSLKICGCCTLDTDSTLYAIDSNYALRMPSYSAAAQTGLIWAFTDCMAKRGPALVTEDKTLIGCDPVSGRAQEVNLCWEQLCVASAYDIEIGKDTKFTIKVIDWVTEAAPAAPATFLVPASLGSPCVYFPAGGLTATAFGVGGTAGSAIAAFGNLECGHTYFWRVKARQCATTQIIRSPWSEVRSFTVKAGLPVVSTYLGLTLLAPNNGCLGCPVQPVSFSWSPFKETTKYKFQLATDAGMTQLVKEAEVVNSTAYEYDGALEYSTNYFWRAMSMEPAPSDWSATFSFQTEAKPVPIETTAGPTATPVWVWVVIAIGAILVIVTLVLIFKTRRV